MIEINNFGISFYKTKYNFNWGQLEKFARPFLNNAEGDDIEVNCQSSYLSKLKKPHEYDELQEYYNFMEPIWKDVIINKWKYPKNREYEVQGSWFIRYDENGHIKPHHHGDSVLVFCAYVKFPKNCGYTEFRDPLYKEKMTQLNIKNEEIFWTPLEVEENDVLIFNGGAHYHRSQPNKSGDERWLLTTNVRCVNKKDVTII